MKNLLLLMSFLGSSAFAGNVFEYKIFSPIHGEFSTTEISLNDEGQASITKVNRKGVETTEVFVTLSKGSLDKVLAVVNEVNEKSELTHMNPGSGLRIEGSSSLSIFKNGQKIVIQKNIGGAQYEIKDSYPAKDAKNLVENIISLAP